MSWLEEVEKLLQAVPVQRVAATGGLTRSAVLVPLYVAQSELWVLLTRRADSLPHHAGQIAFPGGACEEGDVDEVATALRETEEEIGIPAERVLVLGQLDDLATPTGFVISPVVGAVPYPFETRPAAGEVEAVLSVPFSFLANPEMVEHQLLTHEGRQVVSPVYHYRGHRVWGATARIIADLVQRLTGTAPVRAPSP
ncbi:MAG TPA: CoA pyrophosphatase [Thermoanaerobaculaceae bacterium]|nr:CoA pyrophosphatase [Thermoanaerobaculaceae bacterium]HRS15402.1 CoA pyrophosphatase [Thermoanaerobaculaceae bacterium]